MSIDQELGKSFGSAVIGNVPAGQAVKLSGPSADALLGLGADPYATEQKHAQPIQLDGCALNAR